VENISRHSLYLILEYDLQCHKVKMSESDVDRSRYVNAYELFNYAKYLNKCSIMTPFNYVNDYNHKY
jgi:hypothetical protein